MFRKATIISITLSLLAFSACRKTATTSTMLKGDVESYKTEGWIDDDTFQVRALGAASAEARGFVQRRTQSSEAALLQAQKRVIEKLVGADISGASGSKDGESTGLAIVKEFEGHVKGGAIIRKDFNENDDCEITYRVHAKNLKKLAESVATRVKK